MSNPDGITGGGVGTTATEAGAIDEAARHVRDVNQQITHRMTVVMGYVDQFRGVWHGGANQTFTGVMGGWQEELRKVNDALSGIADTMIQNKNTLIQSDEDQTTALRNVAAAGPGPLNL